MKRSLFFVFSFFLAASSKANNEELFRFEGKSYRESDLPPALRQSMFELDRQRYDTVTRLVDSFLLELYVKEEAQKKGKKPEELEQQLFKGKTVNEKDAQTWYDANKSRVGGRSFDSIKGEIVNFLQMQEQEDAQQLVLKSIKGKGTFQLAVTEPIAPQVSITTDAYPSKGSEKAKVTIVEFADYGCPHCKHAAESLKKVVEKNKKNVRFVYMDFPLNPSGVPKQVAVGAVCADEQKKFWDYHYMAFENQASLSKESPAEFAKKLNLDLKKFEACLNSVGTKEKVEFSRNEGERIGVGGTPSIYINGRKQFGYDQETLEEAIKKLL
ncbi:MAG: thioredoxin domain-containing protein [Deltaproteobacteria bacterium]|nr:thioredoxin domain-containing protein [Deltaproteobacteria bacterium]